MSEERHASVPGAAGSLSVNPKASIHLTPAQYYIRLAGAFVVGAAVGVGAAYALKAALLTVEPPIRVRPGSIELHLSSDKKWHKAYKDDGTPFWRIKDGQRDVLEYELEIVTTAPAKCPNGIAVKTDKWKITDSETNSFHVAINVDEERTEVTASDPTKVDLSPDRRVLSISTGGFIAELWDEAKNAEICKFDTGEFVGAWVY